MTLEEIHSLEAEDAIKALDTYITEYPDSDEAYTQRGLRHWALGHRAQAINDYLKAISINPESKAVHALSSARSIMDFYNKDLYNP